MTLLTLAAAVIPLKKPSIPPFPFASPIPANEPRMLKTVLNDYGRDEYDVQFHDLDPSCLRMLSTHLRMIWQTNSNVIKTYRLSFISRHPFPQFPDCC